MGRDGSGKATARSTMSTKYEGFLSSNPRSWKDGREKVGALEAFKAQEFVARKYPRGFEDASRSLPGGSATQASHGERPDQFDGRGTLGWSSRPVVQTMPFDMPPAYSVPVGTYPQPIHEQFKEGLEKRYANKKAAAGTLDRCGKGKQLFDDCMNYPRGLDVNPVREYAAKIEEKRGKKAVYDKNGNMVLTTTTSNQAPTFFETDTKIYGPTHDKQPFRESRLATPIVHNSKGGQDVDASITVRYPFQERNPPPDNPKGEYWKARMIYAANRRKPISDFADTYDGSPRQTAKKPDPWNKPAGYMCDGKNYKANVDLYLGGRSEAKKNRQSAENVGNPIQHL